MSLNREGFQAIPHTLDYEAQVMMVVVEGRRPQCWHCKQLGHFSKSYPKKTTNNNNTKVIASSASTTAKASLASTTVTTTTTPTSKATIPASTPATTNTQSAESGDHPNNNKEEEEGWTQVTRDKKKSPTKAPKSPEKQSPDITDPGHKPRDPGHSNNTFRLDTS